MKNYIQPGKVLTLTAPTGGVTSGTPVQIGSIFCVPTSTVAVGLEFEGLTEGVCDLPKDASVFAVGDLMFWNSANSQVSLTGDGDPVAVATEAALTGAATCEGKLLPAGASAGNYVANGKFRVVVDYTDISAIGSVQLGDFFPAGSRILHSYYDVTTTFTSATDAATISIGFLVDDVAGVLAAVAIGTGTPFDAGIRAGIQVGTIATAGERLTAARQLTFTTGVEVLTAGALTLYGDYYVAAV